VGPASWYGEQYDGKATAGGEPFDMYDFTAAHATLPLGTLVQVTNLSNGKTVIVRVNDRGPFINDRIIDVSYRAACFLDFAKKGVQRVRLDFGEYSGDNSESSANRKLSGLRLGRLSSRVVKCRDYTHCVAETYHSAGGP
jgi:rare lipoprotein A